MSAESRAVFLSYASQDAAAVQRLAEALRSSGVEVWFDQNELVGGDAWDAKIRKQIAECALFVPIISAATQARTEGYFRLEWKLAAQRTHMIADDAAFLLPVVIDATRDAEARVPAEFKSVQWTRLPAGETSVAFPARVQKLLEVGVATGRTGPDPASVPAGTRSVSPAIKSRSLRYGVAGTGLAIALFATARWAGWGSAAPREKSTPAAVTESRHTPRALQLRALTGLSRERLGAADELLAQALKADPTDADALGVAAQVDALMVYRSWDASEERRQSATKRSTRALALAPEGFEPRRAQAMVAAFMLRSPEARREAEAIYRPLSEERPDDAMVLEEFGTVLAAQGKLDDAARIFTRAGRPLLAASAYYWAGRFKPAREICAALLAERRSVEALVLKANVDLFGFNDRAAAAASVSQLTPTELREDDAAGIALRLAVLRADAPGLLKLLEQFPHPFVSILGVNYPRRYWTGMAHEWLKQPDAARIEWRAALDAIEERLKANAGDVDALSWAGMLHMCLGDREATERALRVYRNYRDLSAGYWDFNYCLPLLRLGGREDEVIDRLEKTLREPPAGHSNTIIYAWARFSPEFDPLRKEPRFERLLREMRPAEALPLPDPPAAAPAAEKSVAVLPFANLSDDKEAEYFSDGISEELINVLGRVPGLTVKGRTSSFFFKGKNVPMAEIAQQLGVAYVVRGSVRKSGARVRITAQLSRAATDEVVWSSASLDRELKDVFAVQDEIAGLVAQALSLKLGVASAPAAAGVNPEAHRLYMLGRQAWRQRTAAGYAEAEKRFAQALALDPAFARAHAGLADVGMNRAQDDKAVGRFDQRDSAVLKQIAASVQRALDLEPDAAEARAALGTVRWMEWRFDEGIRELRRAIALNPNSASAHQSLGRTLMANGELGEALAALQRAHELDPLFARVADNYGIALLDAQRPREALAILERALALQPDSPQALRWKAVALAELGRSAEALPVARLYASRPADSGANFAGYALARAGAAAEADRFLKTLDRDEDDAPWAATLLTLGRPEQFFAEMVPHEMTAQTIEVLYFWPAFDPVRDDPRFGQLLETLGVTEAHARAQAWRTQNPPPRP